MWSSAIMMIWTCWLAVPWNVYSIGAPSTISPSAKPGTVTSPPLDGELVGLLGGLLVVGSSVGSSVVGSSVGSSSWALPWAPRSWAPRWAPRSWAPRWGLLGRRGGRGGLRAGQHHVGAVVAQQEEPDQPADQQDARAHDGHDQAGVGLLLRRLRGGPAVPGRPAVSRRTSARQGVPPGGRRRSRGDRAAVARPPARSRAVRPAARPGWYLRAGAGLRAGALPGGGAPGGGNPPGGGGGWFPNGGGVLIEPRP